MPHRPELRDLVAVPTGAPPLPACDVEGWGLGGGPRTVRLASPGHWTLLLFLGSRCDGCRPFWTAPRAPTSCGLEPGDTAVVVTRGPEAEEPEAIAALIETRGREGAVGGGEPLIMSEGAWRTYRVHGPPFFVLVDGVVVATEGVAWSVEQVAADVARVRRPAAGEAARRARVGR